MTRGIHLRYIGDGVYPVREVGVFQQGAVGFTPREVAIALIRTGLFEAVAGGPTAQAFLVRVEQTAPPLLPIRDPSAPDEMADFERELDELEAASRITLEAQLAQAAPAQLEQGKPEALD